MKFIKLPCGLNVSWNYIRAAEHQRLVLISVTDLLWNNFVLRLCRIYSLFFTKKLWVSPCIL